MMEEEKGEIIDQNGKIPKLITAELELPRGVSGLPACVGWVGFTTRNEE